MPDVRMPDGTIVRNVPANATRDQILVAYEKARAQGAVADNRPKSFWQGVAEGIHTPANNFIRATENLNPFVGIPNLAMWAMGRTQPSTADILDKAFFKARANSAYQGGTGGRVVGEVAGTLPAMAFGGGPIFQGALQGALLNQDHSVSGVARDAVLGGVGGKAGDVFGRKVLAPVASKVAGTRGGQAVADLASSALSRLKGRPAAAPAALLPAPKLSPAEGAISKVAPKSDHVAQIAANLQDAQRLGVPYSLADASPQMRALGGSVSRKSMDARQIAEDTFGPRQLEQGERAIDAVRTHLAPTDDVKLRASGLQDAANAVSGPKYEQAFQGGSMAPLESQLTYAFDQSSKAVKDAAQELAAAQRNATVSSANVSRAGENVYANARALPADREAQAAISAAEQKLAIAQAQHEQVLSVLRKSQEDAANNAPGAIWSPRVQQFLDDPIGKPGMARGLETQRIESLAQGKPFNPTEYAITGVDEAGNPIVGNVPNMRTLDAYKKGLDAMIQDETDTVTGRVTQKGRALIMAKNSLLGELDSANPEYGAAREAYGGWMQSRDALLDGARATGKTVSPSQLDATISELAPPQLNEFRTGYASQLVDNVANATDNANPWRTIVGGANRRSKLEALYPEGAIDFNRIASLEGDMAKTATETIGGSPTAARLNVDQQVWGNGLADQVEHAAVASVNPKWGMVMAVMQKLQDNARTGGERKAAEMAPVLFDVNPQTGLTLLEELVRKKAGLDAQRSAYGRLAVPGAVALGVGLSQ